MLNLGFISFRIHHFYRGDDDRAFHDHSWNFLTFILKGSYTDVSPNGEQVLKAGDWAYRRAHHKHTVKTSGVWTFVITGPEIRTWGFWPNGRFKRREKYFKKYGDTLCD